jgi:hypothetical protein
MEERTKKAESCQQQVMRDLIERKEFSSCREEWNECRDGKRSYERHKEMNGCASRGP